LRPVSAMLVDSFAMPMTSMSFSRCEESCRARVRRASPIH
jgi:hypothetical protein